MAILDFQKPDQLIVVHVDDRSGQFEFRPLEPGYGITIGNALRRILLSSLEGYAISWIKIKGADHEFTTIKGVVEDVTEMVLNLKQVRFKQQIDSTSEEVITVKISGQDQFTAGDLNNFTTAFQILNPDLVICNMNASITLEIEMCITKGRGYVPAEENKTSNPAFGTIFIDSIFTPIKNVKYTVDNFRVGQKTDYEKLFIDVTTDGSIHPQDALREASDILIQHFVHFSQEKSIATSASEDSQDAFMEELDENAYRMRQRLKTKLTDLGLSVRALNCLKAADVETLGDLVSHNKTDLLKFRNFGKKSLTELEDLIEREQLVFGMNLAKYKLDQD